MSAENLRTAAGSEKSGQPGNSGDSAEYRRQCTGDGDNAVERLRSVSDEPMAVSWSQN